MDRREANLGDRAEVMLTLSFIVCHGQTRWCGGIKGSAERGSGGGAHTPCPEPPSPQSSPVSYPGVFSATPVVQLR